MVPYPLRAPHGARFSIPGERMHRWRNLTHLIREPLKAVKHLHVLHSPGSSLLLLVAPLPRRQA